MSFAEPSWLWIGALACALTGACFAIEARRRAQNLMRFVAPRHARSLTASLSPLRRVLKRLLTLTAVGCVFGALARPQWGYHLERERRQALELMFAVDTSRSMLAEDTQPNRLQRAKLAVQDLLRALPEAPVGLVAFAGDAFVQTPLTQDRAAFLQSLSALDTSVIPVPGSSLQSAIRAADAGFGASAQARKVLVLISDGEELEGSAIDAARAASAHGVRIYALGVGSPEGASIPVRDGSGRVQPLRGPDGQIVRSQLREAPLRQLAAVSGGRYRALQAGGPGVETLFSGDLSRLAGGSVDQGVKQVREERFQWPLAAGALFLALEWLLLDRRRRAAGPRPAVALGALLTLLGVSAVAQAQGSDTASYNRAAAEYKAGQFDAAARDYQGALNTRDLGLQQRAYYDLGNAQYRQGQAAKDPARQAERYKAAIASYGAALALRKQDADAAYNRDFVRKRLREVEPSDADRQQRDADGGARGQTGSDERQRGSAASSQASSAPQAAGSDERRGGSQQQAAASSQSSATSQAAGTDQQPSGGGSEQDVHGSPQRQTGATDQQQGAPQDQNGSQKDRDSLATRGRPRPEQAHDRASAQAAQLGQPSGAPDDAQGGSAEAAADGGSTAGQSAGLGGMHRSAAPSGEAARAAGLSRAEAARLLDALDSELQTLPSGYAESAAHASGAGPRKDW